MNHGFKPIATGAALLVAGAALAQQAASPASPLAGDAVVRSQGARVWAERTGTERMTRPNGTVEQLETVTTISPMCGSDAVDEQRMAELAAIHDRVHAEIEANPGDSIIVDNPLGRRTGIDISFNLGASVPSQAIISFQQAEAYIENFFSDPIQVRVTVGFENLGGGVIGATGNNNVNRSYNDFRAAIIADADADDTLQTALPTSSGLPVRLNASTSDFINETTVRLSRANGKAIGEVAPTSGTDASMTYNSSFNFDFDPTNGVGNRLSLVDTIVHEVGHAMGFVSAVDFGGAGTYVQPIDALRFVRSGSFDPQTIADFSTMPRSIDFNNPNDQHTFDVITAEYRAEDGSPFQASHFREQFSNIGIMDAAGANGETFVNRSPFGYYTQADLDVFDFIGYDLFDCEAPQIASQPVGGQICAGEDFQLSVDAPTATGFQWTLDGQPITDGIFFTGAQTDTLTILNASPLSNGTYVVTVTNDEDCTAISSPAAINVIDGAAITDQPDNLTLDPGQQAVFTATTSGALGFRWEKDGQAISNGGDVSGAFTDTLTINNVEPTDEGEYRIVAISILCETFSSPATLTVNSSAPTPCNAAGVAEPFDVLDLGDVDAFIAAFGSADPAADIAPPFGVVDLGDIDAFIAAFLGGCP